MASSADEPMFISWIVRPSSVEIGCESCSAALSMAWSSPKPAFSAFEMMVSASGSCELSFATRALRLRLSQNIGPL